MSSRLAWSLQRLHVVHTTRLVTQKASAYLPRHARTMASDVKTILDPPAPNQRVSEGDKIFTTVQEGRAYILVPETAEPGGEQKSAPVSNAGPVQTVFYNPIQQFNRDLTVLAITAYGEEVVEKKKKNLEKKFSKYAGLKKKQAEKKAARAKATQETGAEDAAALSADGSNKRKRGEVDDEESNKVARPVDARSPQGAQANVEVAGEKTNGRAGPVGAMDVDGPAEQSINETTATDTIAPEQVEDGQAETQDGVSKGQNDDHDGSAETADSKPKRDWTAPHFTILDALSATGLRALRYCHEIPFVTKVTANDLDPAAAESIRRNVRHNKLEGAIEVTQGNAIAHMYTKIAAHMALTEKEKQKGTQQYDVIDLDPYGTAANFFDAAVQAVRDDGGLLCVTCTDAGVWASNGYPEKAFALYGGVPIRGWHSHEVGLRLILHAIATSAARYGLTIEPLLSLSIDFYARVFVRITRSPAAVKFAAGKTMLAYTCDAGCGAWTTQLLLKNRAHPNKKGSGSFYKHQAAQGPTADQNCEHCGFRTHLSGPMYAGRLHKPEFIKRILDKLPEVDTAVYGTTSRIKGMLTTALEEHLEESGSADPESKSQEDKYAEIEPYPFFFMTTQLSKTVHCATPSEDALRGALRGLGYRVTRSHCKPGSIKTDAPWSVLWDVIREWIRQKSPIKEANVKPGSAGYRILRLGEGEKKSEDRDENGDASVAQDEKKDANGEKADAQGEKKREVVFDEKLGREKSKERLVRYQMNPRENWGPMNRAKGQ